MQLEKAHERAALAETTVREAVASEMEELLRDMEGSYKVCIRFCLEDKVVVTEVQVLRLWCRSGLQQKSGSWRGS